MYDKYRVLAETQTVEEVRLAARYAATNLATALRKLGMEVSEDLVQTSAKAGAEEALYNPEASYDKYDPRV